jgi:hypothetical protein
MTRILRTLPFLLFGFGVLALPAVASANCDNLVTCFDYLPEHQTADPSWQYSHQCCDLQDHNTIWYVYIDFRGHWHLVSTNIQP